MSRFLAGSTNTYRVFDAETNDGINPLLGQDYTDSSVDCKIVSRTPNMYRRNKPPVENSEEIQVRLTFKPFLGSDTRLPDQIEYEEEFYTFYATKDPGKIMPHFICFAYKPTGIPYE